jgi:Phosphotransferase enzyme family
MEKHFTPRYSPGALTPEFLTDVLRAANVLREATVVSLETKSVGQGMMGVSIRVILEYSRPSAGPASLVAKFNSTDPATWASARATDGYRREIYFYRELAPRVRARIPRAFSAEIDLETHSFLLLMEDMLPARGGDQIAGCSLEDAAVVIDEAANLHGPFWNDPALPSMDWMLSRDMTMQAIAERYPEFFAQFEARYSDRLEPDFLELCRRFCALALPYVHWRPQNWTLQHHDFRLDNLLFDACGGVDPVAILDWQGTGPGPGVLDVAYFLGSGLPTAIRRSNEADLLGRYLDGLRRHGVTDYTPDECLEDYRVSTLQGVLTAVFASVNTKQTPRGDDMFLTMARGACAQAIDHDALGALARAVS